MVPAAGKIPDSLRKCVGFRERKAGARGVTSRGRVAAWAQQEGFSGSRGPSPCGVPRTRIERIAREELGLARPGETVFLIREPSPATGR